MPTPTRTKTIGQGNKPKHLLGVYNLPHEAEELLFDIWLLNQMRHLLGQITTLDRHRDTRDTVRRLGWIIDAAHNVAVDRLRSYIPEWSNRVRPQTMWDFYNLLGQVIANDAVIQSREEIYRNQKRP